MKKCENNSLLSSIADSSVAKCRRFNPNTEVICKSVLTKDFMMKKIRLKNITEGKVYTTLGDCKLDFYKKLHITIISDNGLKATYPTENFDIKV